MKNHWPISFMFVLAMTTGVVRDVIHCQGSAEVVRVTITDDQMQIAGNSGEVTLQKLRETENKILASDSSGKMKFELSNHSSGMRAVFNDSKNLFKKYFENCY